MDMKQSNFDFCHDADISATALPAAILLKYVGVLLKLTRGEGSRFGRRTIIELSEVNLGLSYFS